MVLRLAKISHLYYNELDHYLTFLVGIRRSPHPIEVGMAYI